MQLCRRLALLQQIVIATLKRTLALKTYLFLIGGREARNPLEIRLPKAMLRRKTSINQIIRLVQADGKNGRMKLHDHLGKKKRRSLSAGRILRFRNGKFVTLPICTITSLVGVNITDLPTAPTIMTSPTTTTTPPLVRCNPPISFSAMMIQMIVTAHNEKRRKVFPPATNMRKMSWDRELSWLAGRHTQSCRYHERDAFWRLRDGRFFSPIRRHHGINAEVGFNWFSWGNTAELPFNFIEEAMAAWMSERKFYDHETRRCDSVCRHYLQVGAIVASQ